MKKKTAEYDLVSKLWVICNSKAVTKYKDEAQGQNGEKFIERKKK